MSKWNSKPVGSIQIYLIVNIKALLHIFLIEIDRFNWSNALICFALIIIFPTEFFIGNAQTNANDTIDFVHLFIELRANVIFGYTGFHEIAQDFGVFTQL